MGSCSLSVAVKSVLVMMIQSLVLTTLLLLLSGPLEEVQAVTIRQAEQLQIPPDFNCELCSKCGQSCSVQCALCSGCDLLKASKLTSQDWLPLVWSRLSAGRSVAREWAAVPGSVLRPRPAVSTADFVNNYKFSS